MGTEIDIAFELLRAALTGETPKVEAIGAQQWWSLFRLLQRNHVAALTAEAVASLPQEQKPPRDVLMPWLSERVKIGERYNYQCKVQEDIVGHMERHGIQTLVLKGTTLARHYPTPELREFGDLDLYFYDRHDEADEVARRELGVAIGNDTHHHTRYDYRGVTVESHYDFLNMHYPPSNKRYEALLKEHCPSATFEVLFLLRHMACHFAASRLTLRDVADWTLTCRAQKDVVDWGVVQQTLEDFGMTAFVAALNVIAEQRLGLPTPVHCQLSTVNCQPIERDIVYGTVDDYAADGLGRLGWKLRRWRSLAWKRRMVFSDSAMRLFLASLTAHAEKPQSILHKQ